MSISDPQRIVVVRFDRMGDMVLGANLLVELERAYPNTEIVVFCRPEVSSLRDLLPSRIVWRPVELRIDGDLEPEYVYNVVMPFLNEFHNYSHEILVVANYQRIWLDGLMTVVTKAPHRVGFATQPPLTSGFDELVEPLAIGQRPDFTAVIQCDRDTPEMEKARRMTEFLVRAPIPLSRPRLRIAPQTEDASRALAIQLFGAHSADRRVLLWPGSSGGLRKSLAPADWDKLLRWLRSKRYEAAIVGGPGDTAVLETLRRQMSMARHTSFHQLSGHELPLLAALTGQVRAFVGADSGPAHLAQAVGCPTCVIMGGGTWPRFNPLFGPSAFVSISVQCRGCNWNCPFDTHVCISLIHFEEVESALRWTLKQAHGSNFVREFEVVRRDQELLTNLTSAGVRYVNLLRTTHEMHEDAMRAQSEASRLRRRLAAMNQDPSCQLETPLSAADNP